MMSSKVEYRKIEISLLKTDITNPRIARFLEIYKESPEAINDAAVSLALGIGSLDCATLEESIKANNGIIHPIIVNKTKNNEFIVIEGNTRVQIYKNYQKRQVAGDWDTIPAVIYSDISENEIDSIRLQSHLVGPRDWDPYSKAKFLNSLSNQARLPMSQLVSFCGGNANEVKKMIDAYNDMETYYRPNLPSDNDFDEKKFSAFKELQNRSILESLIKYGYTKVDFGKWVINDNIDKMQNVRMLPLILKNNKAKEVFLKENATEAEKILHVEEFKDKDFNNLSYDYLAAYLTNKLEDIKYEEIRNLRSNASYEDKKTTLLTLMDTLKFIVDDINKE